MIITVLTLFPEIFPPVLSSSIIGRAQKKKIISLNFINIRDFATDRHKTVDDKPYGGGIGMIMKVDIVKKAIDYVKALNTPRRCAPQSNVAGTFDVPKHSSEVKERESNYVEKVILLDPKGKTYNQSTAHKYSKLDHLILVCGHYEGIDSRIVHFVDESVSIGEYVLTGGEIPAMVIIDSVVRLIPQVLSKPEATRNESFSQGKNIEYPQFTRPSNFEGYEVPDVLISGNHEKINKWKEKNRKK